MAMPSSIHLLLWQVTFFFFGNAMDPRLAAKSVELLAIVSSGI